MAEEDLAAAIEMDVSTLTAFDALPSYNAISKAPRAAGYRGSDFVHWHQAADFRAAAILSGIGGTAEAPGRPGGPSASELRPGMAALIFFDCSGARSEPVAGP